MWQDQQTETSETPAKRSLDEVEGRTWHDVGIMLTSSGEMAPSRPSPSRNMREGGDQQHAQLQTGPRPGGGNHAPINTVLGGTEFDHFQAPLLPSPKFTRPRSPDMFVRSSSTHTFQPPPPPVAVVSANAANDPLALPPPMLSQSGNAFGDGQNASRSLLGFSPPGSISLPGRTLSNEGSAASMASLSAMQPSLPTSSVGDPTSSQYQQHHHQELVGPNTVYWPPAMDNTQQSVGVWPPPAAEEWRFANASVPQAVAQNIYQSEGAGGSSGGRMVARVEESFNEEHVESLSTDDSEIPVLDATLWTLTDQGEICSMKACVYREILGEPSISVQRHYHAHCTHVHKTGARSGMAYHHHLLDKITRHQRRHDRKKPRGPSPPPPSPPELDRTGSLSSQQGQSHQSTEPPSRTSRLRATPARAANLSPRSRRRLSQSQHVQWGAIGSQLEAANSPFDPLAGADASGSELTGYHSAPPVSVGMSNLGVVEGYGAPTAEDVEEYYKQSWTREQTKKLKTLVLKLGQSWKEIADALPGKSQVQCLLHYRATHQTKERVRGIGSWSQEEDELLASVVEECGRVWSDVAAKMPGRIPKQCRERYLNRLDPCLRRDPWTKEEEELLLTLCKPKTSKRPWAQICRQLPGRSYNDVKNRYSLLLRRMKKAKLAAEKAAGGHSTTDDAGAADGDKSEGEEVPDDEGQEEGQGGAFEPEAGMAGDANSGASAMHISTSISDFQRQYDMNDLLPPPQQLYNPQRGPSPSQLYKST